MDYDQGNVLDVGSRFTGAKIGFGVSSSSLIVSYRHSADAGWAARAQMSRCYWPEALRQQLLMPDAFILLMPIYKTQDIEHTSPIASYYATVESLLARQLPTGSTFSFKGDTASCGPWHTDDQF
ncbi:hypothetical protein An16g06000 [Aspergillus niger]|uniref:Uncharacterized protein n=2 Tax=Aspergillus niger TaxID=5061 RepID=A2R866_ASPNC|nr:hypothetical protein An16g06000 [Aspergillus niger]CAK46940.1 hypothetical protein An16g06000 [Aspergillus niger]